MQARLIFVKRSCEVLPLVRKIAVAPFKILVVRFLFCKVSESWGLLLIMGVLLLCNVALFDRLWSVWSGGSCICLEQSTVDQQMFAFLQNKLVRCY